MTALKKLLSALIVCALAFSCGSLIACGDSASNTKKTSTNYSTTQNSNSTSQSQEKTKPSEETRKIGTITKAKVTKITDGDTIYVDAYNTRIRIIGVDCPETGTSAGEVATTYTSKLIPPGTTVWLEKDVSETDKYGRPLRYVWLEEPAAQVTKNDVQTLTLNGCLITSGNACAKTYKPDTKYADWFAKM